MASCIVCVWLPVFRPTHPTGLVNFTYSGSIKDKRVALRLPVACPFLAFLPCYAFVSRFWEWYVWREPCTVAPLCLARTRLAALALCVPFRLARTAHCTLRLQQFVRRKQLENLTSFSFDRQWQPATLLRKTSELRNAFAIFEKT